MSVLQVSTDLRAAQGHGTDYFLGSDIPMDTNFLAVDSVARTPLQGRVVGTLPDKSTEGVAVKGTWSRELMAKQNPLWGVGMFQRTCIGWHRWTGIALVKDRERVAE